MSSQMIIIIGLILIIIVLTCVIVRYHRRSQDDVVRQMRSQSKLLIQQGLIAQRDEYDNMFSSINEGLISYDLSMHIHYVNRALLQMLSLSCSDEEKRGFEGMMAGSIFHIYHDGEEILLSLLKECIRGQKTVAIPDGSFMKADKSVMYFPVSGEVIPINPSGKMTGIVIVCHNTSDEEMQKRLFDLAVMESDIYPWRFDVVTRSFEFSGDIMKRFGYKDRHPSTVHSSVLEQLVHPEDLPQVRAFFYSVCQGLGTASACIKLRVKLGNGKGYEWWEFMSNTLEGLTPGEPYMVLGITQCIQSHKDTEKELTRARDKALQADKLKSAFLANMSHEIRTPLNSIVGFSDLLIDMDSFSHEEVIQFATTIKTNSQLLLALMNDILDMSRIEAGTMEFVMKPYSLNMILTQVYDSQRLSIPEGVDFLLRLPEGEDTTLVTDTVRLKQVVNNLVNNAKKFTSKGHIAIGYEPEEADTVCVFVEDTGRGISDEAQKHIFERFFKEDNFTQGAGLGLSICTTILKRLDGDISVASKLGEGTRFEIRFKK